MFIKSLYIKINLTILIVFIIVLSFFTVLMQKRLEEDASDFTKSQAKYLAMTLKRNIEIDMLGYCERGVQNVVEQSLRIPGVEVARIFDPDGIIKYSAMPKEIGKSLDMLDTQASEISNKGTDERSAPYANDMIDTEFRSFCLIEDIYNQKRCHECHGSEKTVIASINLCISMKIAEENISRNQQFGFYTAVVTLAVFTVVLSILLALLVRKPIKKLIKTMTNAERGDLSARVDIKTKDELGVLGGHFNSMLMKLEKANKDIEKYHQEQLVRVGRLATVGEMAAGIAHEIKNPLAGLAGATQILSKEFPDNDKKKVITEEMLKLINRLDKIIKDLLTFSRKAKPELVVSSVNNEIEKVLFFVDPQATQANINICKNLNEEVPRVLMDPEQVQQVFLNIALNSIHAMPEGGTLTIDTSSHKISDESDVLDPGIYVVTSFKDTGLGIPEDILQRIFKPFFTTKEKGTGLGLSISQKIIEEHKGKILVESEEGVGTEFKVYLPKRYS